MDAIVEYVKDQDLASGRKLAERLQKVTTNKSGLGLLFIIVGADKGIKKIVISRFPAEQGILAEESERSLTVEFLEKVFMKSATSYKAVMFSGASPSMDFWKGRAIDKQINNPESTISNYWIRDFLHADFLTPGELGTRRMAVAVKEAINRATDLSIKDELSAASKLLGGFDGKVHSAKEIVSQLNLSAAAQEVIKVHFPKERLFDERFKFVAQEASSLLAFKTVELDNGGLLTAPADKFEKVFRQEEVSRKNNIYRFATEGRIVDQRMKKSKQ